MSKILAISGSPIPNSNIDQAIKTILENTKQPYNFIKLCEKEINPCKACLKCAKDNKCKQKDDYAAELESLALQADIWIIGGWPPFGTVDALTKSFCERTFSLRHKRLLTKGKKGVIVAGGYHHSFAVKEFLEGFFAAQNIDLMATLELKGNVPCLACGHGESCPISNVKGVWGAKAKITEDKFWQFKDHDNLIDEAKEIGQKLNNLYN